MFSGPQVKRLIMAPECTQAKSVFQSSLRYYRKEEIGYKKRREGKRREMSKKDENWKKKKKSKLRLTLVVVHQARTTKYCCWVHKY